MPTYPVDIISFLMGCIFGIVLVFALTAAFRGTMSNDRDRIDRP